MMTGKYGDWGKIERMLSQAGNKLRREVSKATGELGPALVAIVVKHFQSQDLGWPPLNEKYARQKAGAARTKLRKLTKRELKSRLGKLGIAFDESAGKSALAGALAGANQILVLSGTLMDNINAHQIDDFSGYVGVLRREGKHGYDLAYIHEFGSRDGRIPARPYMRPSVKEFKPLHDARYQQAVDAAFK